MKILLILILFSTAPTHEKLLGAIKQVESNGGKNKKDGDNGRSIGPYQIGKAYFKDAVQHCPELGIYQYQDCRKNDVSILIIRAYWKRYATKERLGREPTDKDRARIHNGGLNGYKFENKAKEARLVAYWAKVKKGLK